ncbi:MULTISPECIES: nucleobase:cation symporter-2 family protein [unclassified Clostridium]|uniref:nucleobase:cation symporter-2 family protein n=1 Tax=unclassified Clostridium TaxID=2614128 RepID=UPI0013CD918C|nr:MULTISPECIES: nucleobase:cation symporter-2 family protein [unclassified Clostridium]NFI93441.1 purine permease [Clostridium botulinum]NFO90098.1 purine permease [Clostridium botulinum]
MSSENNTKTVDKVNEMLPIGQLATFGLQHVLAMYAGAVAVPLIIGAAVGLSPEQLSLLVAADLFTCGIATLLQAIGIGNFAGIKLPVILGCTFAAVGPLIIIGKSLGMDYAYGSIIVGAIVVILIAPLYGKLLKFFPTVVTGSVVTIIGLSLINVGVTSCGGGANAADFGSVRNILLSIFVMLVILISNKYLKGFFQSIAVLNGIILGTIVGSFMGMVDFSIVSEAKWISFVKPFTFGIPKFDTGAIFMMTLVMITVMVESTGTFLGVSKLCGKKLTEKDIVKGLRAEGLATILGGIFNSFPYTTFNQNLGLLSLSKVFSRFVVVASGIILMALGLIPKFAALATIIPQPVIGGATTIMFGTVAVAGIKMLLDIDLEKNSNVLIVATSLAVGLGITAVPTLLSQTPQFVQSIFGSGIVSGSIVAIILNAWLNHGEAESNFSDNCDDDNHIKLKDRQEFEIKS